MIPECWNNLRKRGMWEVLYFSDYPFLPEEPPDKARLTAQESAEFYRGWRDGQAAMYIPKDRVK